MAPKKSVKKSVDVTVEKKEVPVAAVPVHVTKSADNDSTNVFTKVLNNYSKQSTPKLKLIDSFLAFLVVLGVFQFVFCLLVGNFVSMMMRGDGGCLDGLMIETVVFDAVVRAARKRA